MQLKDHKRASTFENARQLIVSGPGYVAHKHIAKLCASLCESTKIYLQVNMVYPIYASRNVIPVKGFSLEGMNIKYVHPLRLEAYLKKLSWKVDKVTFISDTPYKGELPPGVPIERLPLNDIMKLNVPQKRLAETDWQVIKALEKLFLSDTELHFERELLRAQVARHLPEE